MAQDQIRKALVSHSNMRGQTFKPGVDYYAKAIESGAIELPMTCPESGGAYTAYVETLGGELIITCTDHGDEHRE